jgi:hypothetical protein
MGGLVFLVSEQALHGRVAAGNEFVKYYLKLNLCCRRSTVIEKSS